MIGYLGLLLLLLLLFIIDNNNQAARRWPNDFGFLTTTAISRWRKKANIAARGFTSTAVGHTLARHSIICCRPRGGGQSRCCAARELCAFALCSTDRDDRTRLSLDRSCVGLEACVIAAYALLPHETRRTDVVVVRTTDRLY